jgi:hypothetical protein
MVFVALVIIRLISLMLIPTISSKKSAELSSRRTSIAPPISNHEVASGANAISGNNLDGHAQPLLPPPHKMTPVPEILLIHGKSAKDVPMCARLPAFSLGGC